MKNFPKVFNTKKDYENCLGQFPEQTRAKLKSLADGRFIWADCGEIAQTKTLDTTGIGVQDSFHAVRPVGEGEEYTQQEVWMHLDAPEIIDGKPSTEKYVRDLAEGEDAESIVAPEYLVNSTRRKIAMHQFEKVEDSNAEFFALGFTIQEIKGTPWNIEA
jgi:hypothetical protein